jgi:hypothetical protein
MQTDGASWCSRWHRDPSCGLHVRSRGPAPPLNAVFGVGQKGIAQVRTYELEMPLLMRVLPFVGLALVTVGVPATLLSAGGPIFLIIPVLAIMGWNWWVLMTLAHRVVVHDDGIVEWVALGRRVRTLPEDVREIRPERSGQIGFFSVQHSAGKVRFINQITGFHEVLAHIKSRNPTVVIKGC